MSRSKVGPSKGGMTNVPTDWVCDVKIDAMSSILDTFAGPDDSQTTRSVLPLGQLPMAFARATMASA